MQTAPRLRAEVPTQSPAPETLAPEALAVEDVATFPSEDTSHVQVECLLPAATITCDAGIAVLVEALNLAGVETNFSCEGTLPTPDAPGDLAYLTLSLDGWCTLRDRLRGLRTHLDPDLLELFHRMAGGASSTPAPLWGEELPTWACFASFDLPHLLATGHHRMRLVLHFHPADILPAATLVAACH